MTSWLPGGHSAPEPRGRASLISKAQGSLWRKVLSGMGLPLWEEIQA